MLPTNLHQRLSAGWWANYQVIEMRRHHTKAHQSAISLHCTCVIFQKRSALLQEDLAGIGHCASLKRKAVDALVNQQKESANGLGPECILHWVFLLDARDNSNATNHGVNQLNNLLIQEIITKLCIDASP